MQFLKVGDCLHLELDLYVNVVTHDVHIDEEELEAVIKGAVIAFVNNPYAVDIERKEKKNV